MNNLFALETIVAQQRAEMESDAKLRRLRHLASYERGRQEQRRSRGVRRRLGLLLVDLGTKLGGGNDVPRLTEEVVCACAA